MPPWQTSQPPISQCILRDLLLYFFDFVSSCFSLGSFASLSRSYTYMHIYILSRARVFDIVQFSIYISVLLFVQASVLVRSMSLTDDAEEIVAQRSLYCGNCCWLNVGFGNLYCWKWFCVCVCDVQTSRFRKVIYIDQYMLLATIFGYTFFFF